MSWAIWWIQRPLRYWHSVICVWREDIEKKRKKKITFLSGSQISSLFRLSVLTRRDESLLEMIGTCRDGAAEHSHFSLPSFRDVHLRRRRKNRTRHREESPAAFSFFFSLSLLSSHSTGSIRFGWVQEGNGNDHLSGRYSPFSVGSSWRACSCPFSFFSFL